MTNIHTYTSKTHKHAIPHAGFAVTQADNTQQASAKDGTIQTHTLLQYIYTLSNTNRHPQLQKETPGGEKQGQGKNSKRKKKETRKV